MKLISIIESMMLDELSNSSHSVMQNKNRVEWPEYYDVITKMHLGDENIGKYWLNREDKLKIKNIYDHIEKVQLKEKESYIIVIHKFKTHIKDITFNGNTTSEKNRNMLLYNDNDVFLSTPKQFGIPSVGKYLICVIYDNKIITTFLIKSIKDTYILTHVKTEVMPRLIYDPIKELSPAVEAPQLPNNTKPVVDKGKLAYLSKINKYKKK